MKSIYSMSYSELSAMRLRLLAMRNLTGVVTEAEIANSFCEKVPFYASRIKSDFRRPYELASDIYADGNLSVDRALVKARKAIVDLGLNPFDFKYKYENTNMLLGTGMFA